MSVEYIWRVTHREVGRLKIRGVPDEETALLRARFLRSVDVCKDIRIERRRVDPWEPVYQSEFPGEAREND